MGWGFEELGKAVTDVGNAVKGVGEAAQSILGDVSGLQGAIGLDPTVFVKRLIEAALKVVPEFTEAFAKLTREMSNIVNNGVAHGGALAAPLGEAIGFLGQISGNLTRQITQDGGILPNLFKSLEDVNEKIASDVFDPIFAVGPLPKALRGPLASLESLKAYTAVLTALNRADRITERGKAVVGAMEDLAKILDLDAASPFITILGKRLVATLDLIAHAGDTTKLVRDAARVLIFPFDLFGEAFRALAPGNAKIWDTIPGGLQPGDLDAWLNMSDDALRRQFKVRLVAEVDNWLRGVGGNPTLRDGQISTNALAALVGILMKTTVTFILEPDCYPIGTPDWGYFEDIGFDLGVSLGGQIDAQIRLLAGTMLRGLWIWSVGNDNVIEGLGALIGAALGGIAEGIIRNVTWTFEIRSAYPADIPAGDIPAGTAIVVHEWPSSEKIANDARRLRYVALVRDDWAGAPALAVKAILADGGSAALRGLIQDVGAYIDVAYRRFLIESRFRRADDREKVTITKADWTAGALTIWATSSLAAATPRPVLRVYAGCEIAVMQPGDTPTDRYTCNLTMHHGSPRNPVRVLSNLGGVAQRDIYVVQP